MTLSFVLALTPCLVLFPIILFLTCCRESFLVHLDAVDIRISGVQRALLALNKVVTSGQWSIKRGNLALGPNNYNQCS